MELLLSSDNSIEPNRAVGIHLLEIFNYLEPNQIFGRIDILKYLNFSYANAGKIIVTMKNAKLIEELKGKG